VGVGANVEGSEYTGDTGTIVQKVKDFWCDPELEKRFGSGVRASSRLPYLVPYGKRKFAP
jgi:hypothetical protein